MQSVERAGSGKIATFLALVFSLCLVAVYLSCGVASATERSLTAGGASRNQAYAGYEATGTKISVLSGTITVPRMSCTSSGSSAGSPSDSVQEDGSHGGASAFITFGCEGSTPVYSGQMIIGPPAVVTGPITFVMQPGDRISVTIKNTTRTTSIKAVNETTHEVSTLSGKLPSDVDDGWFELQDLNWQTSFRANEFSSCTVNGKPLATTTHERFNLVDASGKLAARASPIGPDGKSFEIEPVT